MSALAVVLVLIALRLLNNASNDLRFPLPALLEDALPTLAPRLSMFLPAAVVVAGVILIVVALLLIASGWRLLNVGAWLSGTGLDLIWRLLSVALILIVLATVWAVLTSWIDRRLSLDLTGKAVSARSRTLLALFSNAVTIALVVFGGMTALSELGVDIAPLLAGAGVIGLAVGFGAQKLVQDIITGIFIQLENAINEGDVVTVAGITGGVEKLTIRSVGIRDMSGVYHLIPFSAVDTVGNYMRLFGYHVEVVGIAYDSDLDVAERAMHDAFDAVKAGKLGAEIIAPLEFHGVVALGDSAVNLRARIKTKPGQQWAVGRAYTREVKRALDAAGIDIPFPHRELKLPQAMLERLIPPPNTPNTSKT
jgi:small conductance mechanosensitive channel